MGLDVRFFAKVTKVDHPEGFKPTEDCWDNHEVVWVKDFPQQADGIPHQSCWQSEAGHTSLHHSYSGYGQYRAWLCMGFFGVEPEKIWEDTTGLFQGRPFYEQINFADNEGTIGPKTAAKLAQDYVDQRDYVIASWKALPVPFDSGQAEQDRQVKYMTAKYDEWAAGFALAADTGMVIFS